MNDRPGAGLSCLRDENTIVFLSILGNRRSQPSGDCRTCDRNCRSLSTMRSRPIFQLCRYISCPHVLPARTRSHSGVTGSVRRPFLRALLPTIVRVQSAGLPHYHELITSTTMACGVKAENLAKRSEIQYSQRRNELYWCHDRTLTSTASSSFDSSEGNWTAGGLRPESEIT